MFPIMNKTTTPPQITASQIIRAILILLALIVLFSSCTSSRKFKATKSNNEERTTEAIVDSLAVSKTDSSGRSAINSISTARIDSQSMAAAENSSREKITVNLRPDSASGARLVPANEYAGAALVYNVTINGNKIQSSRPIDNIVVENESGRKTLSATQLSRIDSASRAEETNSIVNKTDSASINSKSTASEKKSATESQKGSVRIGSSAAVWVPVLLFVVAGGFLAWRFGWLRKKRSANESGLSKMTYDPPVPPITKT